MAIFPAAAYAPDDEGAIQDPKKCTKKETMISQMLKPSKIIKASNKIITTRAMTKITMRTTTITIIIKITLINMIRTTSNSQTQWKKILFPTIKLIVIKKK